MRFIRKPLSVSANVSDAEVLGVDVPIPTDTRSVAEAPPSTIALFWEVDAPYPIAVLNCPRAEAVEPKAVDIESADAA